MLRGFVDTIFSPILGFLSNIYNILHAAALDVPTTAKLSVFNYFSYLGMFGEGWKQFVITAAFLAFMYLILYVIVNNLGFLQKLKNLVKWW